MVKQDCAIKILKYLQQYMNYALEEAINYCEELVDEDGLYPIAVLLLLSELKGEGISC